MPLPVGNFAITKVTTSPAVKDGSVLPGSGAPVAAVNITIVVGAACATDALLAISPRAAIAITIFFIFILCLSLFFKC